MNVPIALTIFTALLMIGLFPNPMSAPVWVRVLLYASFAATVGAWAA